jgi:hypothetical protein
MEVTGGAVKISPAKIAVALSSVVCSLLLAHLVTQALRVYGGYDFQLGFQRQFNLDGENNIPSWYASSALFLCAFLLGLVGFTKRYEQAPRAGQWLSLAAIFFFLSMDEAASIHEMVSPLARVLLDRIGVSIGYLHFSWVILGIVVVPLVGFSYLRFLRALPRATSRLFVIAGLLYVGGAVGIEMFGAKVASQGGMGTMFYAVLVAVEEGLEMFGIVLFSYALLSYIGQQDMAVSLLRMHQSLFVRSGDSVPVSAVLARDNDSFRRQDRVAKSASMSLR